MRFVANPSTKTQTEYCVLLYGCALSPDPILELVDFRTKQVPNLQFALFVTTDRCYGKCSGVCRVQQVPKGGGVWSHPFHSAYWSYQPGMVANSARGQLSRENRLRTRNRKSQRTSHLCLPRPFRCQCS